MSLFRAICAMGVTFVNCYSCLNETGQFADFWVSLKENNSPSYFYHDADHKLAKSEYTMEDNKGGLMKTIGQLYKKMGKSYAYAMYNDATPAGKSTNGRAHSKGVILFNGEMGFWLVHSFPSWPAAVEDGYNGLPGVTFAQSFMCMTFRLSELEELAKIHLVQWPQVYSSGVSKDLAAQLPLFTSWIGNNKDKDNTRVVTTLTSYNGRHFEYFGKSNTCACNLWSDMVAPGLKANLRVETWQNGAHNLMMPNFCKSDGYKYNVMNVSVVGVSGATWQTSQDHSKWAVSDSTIKTVCIGDINRQYSQDDRGGGAVCYANSVLWGAFDKAVEEDFGC